MKLNGFLVFAFAFGAISGAAFAADIPAYGVAGTTGAGQPTKPVYYIPTPFASNPALAMTAPVKEGAMPETSEAEKARAQETQFHKETAEISALMDSLQKRLSEFRRMAQSPFADDMDRAERDMKAIDDRIARLETPLGSALVDFQREDLQDKAFELRVSLELLRRRWGGTYNVFGTEFFSGPRLADDAAKTVPPASYRIRPGDALSVAFSSKLGEVNEYHPVVDDSGKIFVRGVGSVTASGKTTGELRASIANRISSSFKQLDVSVSVERVGAVTVQVAGEVARPGTYTMSGLATVLNALYQAGGPTASGSFRKISVVGQNGSKRAVDLYELLVNGSRKQDYPLSDGDMVFVPSVGPTIVVEGEVVRAARYEPNFPISAAQALELAGGPKSASYTQYVTVERIEGGEYKTLLSVSLTDDGGASFSVRPGDVIAVASIRPERSSQVEITGPVLAPGVYGFRGGMRVNDLIALARGFAPGREVYGQRADILRIEPLEGLKLITVNLDEAQKGDSGQNIELQRLDRLFVYEPDQVAFRPRVVRVLGAVARPGIYRRNSQMTVRDAVAAAGGVLPEAFLERADVIRRKADDSTELLAVNLRDALSGDPAQNPVLADQDEIGVYTNSQVVWRDSSVRVEGSVQRPGNYMRSDNMRVSDLIFASGGLVPESGNAAELARTDPSGSTEIVTIELAEGKPAPEQDMLLRDRDVLTIPAVNPSLRAPEVVFVTGEVARPGPYTLRSRNEKLSQLIERAGGLTESANINGLLFVRPTTSFENDQARESVTSTLKTTEAFANKQMLVQLAQMGLQIPERLLGQLQPADGTQRTEKTIDIREIEDRAKEESSKSQDKTVEKPYRSLLDDPKATATEPVPPSAMGDPVKAANAKNTEEVLDIRRKVEDLGESSRISIDLKRALAETKSADNINLRNGDRLFIPRINGVVQVVGAVLHPHAFVVEPGKNANYYVERSGGFAQNASRSNVIVIRPNGDAIPSRGVRIIQADDTIVVPTTGLVDIAKKWEQVGSVTKVISDILSSVFVLTRF